MLDDKQIKKLCHGCIIKAEVYNSSDTDAAGPHWAIILDADDAISEHDRYYVVVISHDDQIDEFIMSVPAHAGLDGFIQCSWVPEVDLAGITEVWPSKLSAPEMVEVLQLVRQARAARAAKTKKRSTQS